MSPSKRRRSPLPEERRRDPERTRNLILDAATAEFAAHGYAGARTGAIAARAGVNQQLIWYYFDSKEGLAQAIAERWRQRRSELGAPDMPLSEQFRRYTLEALNNRDGARLFAWFGLEYSGPESDPDHEGRAERFQRDIDEVRALQAAGRLPAEMDPACLIIMLTAAAMAPTTMPQVIECVCRIDPRSPGLLHHYADQVAILTRHLGLDQASTRSG